MKNIIKKIKLKDKYYFPSVYFGFLSAFAILILFFMAKTLLNLIPNLPKIYSILSALIIYFSCLIFSYDYAEYDKDLRRSLLFFSVILWVAYLFAIILNYLIK